MSRIIRFSHKNFSKNILLLAIMLVVANVFLVFSLKEYKELVYFFSVLICSSAILMLLYKIRLHPYLILIDENNINIEYLNKSFFRQKSFSGNIEDIDIEKIKDRIILSKQNQTIAVIINTSVSKEDEEFLFSVYKKVEVI